MTKKLVMYPFVTFVVSDAKFWNIKFLLDLSHYHKICFNPVQFTVFMLVL